MADKFYRKKKEEEEEEEEAEERLSFCDLPLYSSDSSFSSSISSSSSSSSSDLFEFFSSHLKRTDHPAENVLFCGKLIVSKQSKSSVSTHKPQIKEEENPKIESRLQSKSKWLSRERISDCSNGGKGHRYLTQKNQPKSRYATNSNGYRRMSGMASPVYPPRRQAMVFGVARLPVEMELSEIRSRQGRQSPAATVLLNRDGDGRIRREKRLWGMIRALGCGGGHLSTAVEVA